MSSPIQNPQRVSASANTQGGSSPWLATISRLYFYLVSLISLVAGLAGLNGLLGTLARVWLASESPYTVLTGSFLREAIARNGGILLVATPIFLLHWAYIQKRFVGREEISAGVRKFFLYGASVVALVFLFISAHQLIGQLVRVALGESLRSIPIWPDGWLALLLMGLAAWGLRLYLQSVLTGDGDYGRESGMAGHIRRLFLAALGLATLVMILLGAGGLLETLWRVILPVARVSGGPDWWRSGIGNGLALGLIGGVAWRINWQRWLAITDRNPQEAVSAVRRVFLYVGMVASALTTLVPATLLVRQIFLILLGSGSGPLSELLFQLTTPLGYVPVGLLAWRWHWRVLAGEAETHGDSPQSATIRRLYYYLVSAAGLGLLWFGLVEVVQVGLDALLGAGGLVSTPGPFWTTPLANGLSLLAVGAPVWVSHWRAVQVVARQADEDGHHERISLTRRAYLYGVSLAGALIILASLASVVYRLLLALLGDPQADLLSVETAHDLSRSLISGALWAVHVIALRRDGRYGDVPGPAAERRQQERQALQTRILALEEELSGLRHELARLEETVPPADLGT